MFWSGSPTAVTGWPPPKTTPKEHGLRVVRVLVLVEQDGAEPVAIRLADGRMSHRDADRVRDLVAEVDHAELRLDVAEHADRRARSRSAPWRRRAGPAMLALRERVDLALDVLDHGLGFDEMVLRAASSSERM